MTTEGLAAAGVPSLWRLCKGAGHTITEEALALGGRFLKGALSGRYRGWEAPQRKPTSV